MKNNTFINACDLKSGRTETETAQERTGVQAGAYDQVGQLAQSQNVRFFFTRSQLRERERESWVIISNNIFISS